MPTVEEYLRSTQRPRRTPLPPPVAIDVPERIRRRAGAARPPRRRRPRARTRAKLRTAAGIVLVGAVIAGGVGAALEDHDGSSDRAPIIVTIPSLPVPGSVPVVICPASQRPGLTTTQDVVVALVQIRVAAAANPTANCGFRLWTHAFATVDDFATLGAIRSPVVVSAVDGPLTATPGVSVEFTVSNGGTGQRFETTLSRSLDGREWRMDYLRAVPEASLG